ncbi:hypothetical protein CR203_01730 [Salipaludibacillus neizhouensis]|uniref:Uncharacterized protein n=1 Tax=Salipaludibacillus neizhouensis TaxID=885475 RepID=A0A3A9KE51_9BACI|nr:hypothetical protein [Salipaludibacillus neizhouensis]RKL68791.1 hypothetical protein CR203_01730 [Salipaludibacillus neizhouensis]
MEELYKQIQVYLKMEEEIPFDEFENYYKKIIKTFNEQADQFAEEDVWKALFISENVMSNAEDRSKQEKGQKAKKFAKMSQRLTLWAKNFAGRLGELGYNEEQLNERFEKMFEEKAE